MHASILLSIAFSSFVAAALGASSPGPTPAPALVARKFSTAYVPTEESRLQKRKVVTVTKRVTTKIHGKKTVVTKKIRKTVTSSAQAAPTTVQAAVKVSSMQSIALAAHNKVRAAHGAKALTWNPTLAAAAQKWANGCKWGHSGGSLGPYGENLAAYAGVKTTVANAVQDWAAEAKDYNPNNPTYSHFTQVVWKSTTQVGCAVASCSGIFSAEYGKASYYVCEYSPAGNIDSKAYYQANVQV
ncbi:PR-1-like protein [Meredithblackwellia eburnea MCA 4105]